VGRGCTRLA